MRTLAELQDELDRDLSWRRVELQALRAAARTMRGPAVEAQCRAGVALLYAHWEGYARFALSAYLKFVVLRRLKYGELHTAFVARGAAHAIKPYGKSDVTVEFEKAKWMLEAGDVRCRISPQSEIDTRSNLNSDVCGEILNSLGLASPVFETKAHFIDYALLRARNEIAHGQWLGINVDDYGDLHDEVFVLLSTLRKLVMDAADAGAYRR